MFITVLKGKKKNSWTIAVEGRKSTYSLLPLYINNRSLELFVSISGTHVSKNY